METSVRNKNGWAYLSQALLLLVLLAIAFPNTFFRGEVIFPGDILFESLPWRLYAPPGWDHAQNRLLCDMTSAFMPYYWTARQALDNGEWPLWNAYEFGGAPLLANWQSAVFYPPRLLHAFMDLSVATTICVVLKLWLCGMTAFLCARTMRLSVSSARFVSVAWMLNGYNFVWCNWSIPDVTAWLPVVFLGTELLLERRTRQGVLAIMIGGTLSLLAGHPESAFIINLGFGLYLVLRLLLERRGVGEGARILGLWIGAWAVAVIVCSVQILPFLEYLRHSMAPPGNRSNMGAHPGLPTRALACLWVPRFFGATLDLNYWGDLDTNRFLMNYAGVATWLALPLLLLRGASDPRRRARVLALLIAGAIFFLLTFEVPPFDLVHGLPVFNMLKRTYYITFAMFALPLLAGMALDRWFAQPRRARDLAGCIALAAALNLFLWVIYNFFSSLIRMMHFEAYLRQQMLIFWVIAGLFIVLLAVSCMRSAAPWVQLLLPLLIAADLLIAGRHANATMPRSQLYPDTQLTQFLQSAPKPCRIGLIQGMIPPGFMTPYGIEDIAGYDGIYPERVVRFQFTLETDVWKTMEPLYNITYYLNDPEMVRARPLTPPSFPIDQTDRFERVATLDELDVYQNKRALPRAFLVGRARVIEDRDQLFDAMRDPAFEPSKEVLVEAPLPGPMPEAAGDSPGSATVVRHDSTRVIVETDAAEPRVLVLDDAYYPGWKATIDGRNAPVFPTYYMFRGVLLPAGKHTVEFRYAPASFYAGLTISSLALLISIGWSLRTLARRK